MNYKLLTINQETMQITDNPNTISFTPGPASRYMWQVSGPNPCPRCAELDGQIRTIESWESSIMPGLHKHCRCSLVCVEAIDSGWFFTDQFGYIAGTRNVDGSISFDPVGPAPHHLGSSPNPDLPEGYDDIVPPYVPPPYHYDPPAPYVPPPYHYD